MCCNDFTCGKCPDLKRRLEIGQFFLPSVRVHYLLIAFPGVGFFFLFYLFFPYRHFILKTAWGETSLPWQAQLACLGKWQCSLLTHRELRGWKPAASWSPMSQHQGSIREQALGCPAEPPAPVLVGGWGSHRRLCAGCRELLAARAGGMGQQTLHWGTQCPTGGLGGGSTS